jgi:hypothetical protein
MNKPIMKIQARRERETKIKEKEKGRKNKFPKPQRPFYCHMHHFVGKIMPL